MQNNNTTCDGKHFVKKGTNVHVVVYKGDFKRRM